MKIFYSHHLYKYFTQIETYETELIKRNFPDAEIINPNLDLGIPIAMDEEEAMKICLAAVEKCDAVVFSSLSGVIGKGVYDEVNFAFAHDIPVYYISENKVQLLKDINYEILNEKRRIYAVVHPVIEVQELEICKNCAHKNVCSHKEQIVNAKNAIVIPEYYKTFFPFVGANFYCKDFKPENSCLLPCVEDLF